MNIQDTLVVLDTCVLLKPRLSDVLMDLRAEKLFSAHWNDTIDSEFSRNMHKVYGVSAVAAQTRLKAMKRRCPEWQVPMSLLDSSRVPAQVHVNDVHVAATALALLRYADEPDETSSEPRTIKIYIVTENIRHMASRQMRALGIEVMKAGPFLNLVYKSHPAESERAILQAVRDLRRPPYTREELLWALDAQGATTLVEGLSTAWGVVPVPKEPALPAALSRVTDHRIALNHQSIAPAVRKQASLTATRLAKLGRR